MTQVLHDLLWHAQQKRNLNRFFSLILQSMEDTLMQGLIARDEHPKPFARLTGWLALIAILPPALFAFVNIMKYNLGVGFFYNSIVDLDITWGSGGAYWFLEHLLVGLPLVAISIAVLPLIHIEYLSERGILLGRSNARLSTLSASILGFGGMIFSIFMLYGIVENF